MSSRASLIVLALAGSLTFAAFWYLLLGSPDALQSPCDGMETRLEGIWDPAVRAELEGVYRESELLGAQPLFSSVAEALDHSAAGWVEGYTGACERTQVIKSQSVELGALQAACLDERRFELAAVAGALSRPTPELIAAGPELIATLEPASACEDATALWAHPLPPEALRDEAQLLTHRLVELELRLRIQPGQPLGAELDALLTQARALGFEPLLARVEALSELSPGGSGQPRL